MAKKEVTLKQNLEKLWKEAAETIAQVETLEALDRVRVKFLGKKGKLTVILRSLGSLPSSHRPQLGRLANEIRRKVETSLAERRGRLSDEVMEVRLEEEALDITLPGKQPLLGKKHIITQVIEEVVDIFIGLGYQVAEGPEIELDYYNFEALNTPADHPARSLTDTLYIQKAGSEPASKDILLRTHTSPVQIRVMEKTQPPVYVIAPGKAYRRDVPDPTHIPMFHQVEGLAVDEGISLGNLKSTLEVFAQAMFGQDRKVRFRPHFFPFTEPSAEVDVLCIGCDGAGCRICGGNGWLEILGCGMVDPNVLDNVGYDTEKFTGFAFGMGVERIAMLKYSVGDLRAFFENDLRFLRQF